MARKVIELECLECGEIFKVSPSNSDQRCPNCRGCDHEVYYSVPTPKKSTGFKAAAQNASIIGGADMSEME
jgi:hypothetical protein